MEAVGARLGRSSSRYGPTTVFTGPVRKWKKKWIHVAPSTSSNGNSSSGRRDGLPTQSADGSNGVKSNVMLYKWTPVFEKGSSDGTDETTPGKDDDEEERPKKKLKFIPIALLEEQQSEAVEQADEETKATTGDQTNDVQASKKKIADEKPDINDTPMKDDEEEETECDQEERQDLNKTTLDLSVDLTGNDEENNGDHMTL